MFARIPPNGLGGSFAGAFALDLADVNDAGAGRMIAEEVISDAVLRRVMHTTAADTVRTRDLAEISRFARLLFPETSELRSQQCGLPSRSVPDGAWLEGKARGSQSVTVA
jgi:hypothetical protein